MYAMTANYTIPKTWTKDFTITVYDGGGMAYESTNITYTYDSCTYDRMEEGVHDVKTFKLSDADRAAVLAKLREYKLDQVKSSKLKGIAYDKPTTKICTGQKSGSKCIESSASTRISSNADGFYKAYDYLVAFASKKR